MPSSTSPPTSLAICPAPSAPAPGWMPKSLRTSARPAGPAGAAVLVAQAVQGVVLAVVALRVALVAETGTVGIASVTVAFARALVAMRGMPLAAPPRRTTAVLVATPALDTSPVRELGRGLGWISRVVNAAAAAHAVAPARSTLARAGAARHDLTPTTVPPPSPGCDQGRQQTAPRTPAPGRSPVRRTPGTPSAPSAPTRSTRAVRVVLGADAVVAPVGVGLRLTRPPRPVRNSSTPDVGLAVRRVSPPSLQNHRRV